MNFIGLNMTCLDLYLFYLDNLGCSPVEYFLPRIRRSLSVALVTIPGVRRPSGSYLTSTNPVPTVAAHLMEPTSHKSTDNSM